MHWGNTSNISGFFPGYYKGMVLDIVGKDYSEPIDMEGTALPV
jgi:hypothetical protein